jgi:Restriction endonuclease S subunits
METELSAFTPADWRVRSVEEVCIRVTSGGTPSRRKPAYYIGGSWPWVKTQELQDGWLHDTEEHITDEAVARSSAKVLPTNSVLVAMYGATVGQLGILRRPMTCNQACSALVVDPAEADYRYLFFQLLHARSRLKSLATGAAQQNLSGVLIKSLRFPFPPLSEQLAIAHILGTLDDKIELNRRTNETLESIARALFKSWFVDFDPVRAKSEGRDPRIPPHLADLFPEAFEDSELGQIPLGWVSDPLASIAEVVDCSHAKKPERRSIGSPLLQLGTIGAHAMLDPTDLYLVGESDYRAWTARIEAREGDCVITNVGRVGAVAQIPSGFRAALGRNMTGLRCRSAWAFPTFLIELIRSDAFRSEIDSKTDAGTILDALNVRSIPHLRFVRPPVEVAQAFESLTRPLRARMEQALAETASLAAARDALLPGLMSGHTLVKSAERIDEAMQ